MRNLAVLIVIMGVIGMLATIPPAHANQTLMYQDFSGTTIPATINLLNGTSGPLTTAIGVTKSRYITLGGWMDMWLTAADTEQSTNNYMLGLMTNGTSPVITAGSGDNRLTVLTIRMIATNATLGYGNGFVNSIQMGFADHFWQDSAPGQSFGSHKIYFSGDISTPTVAPPSSASYSLSAGVALPEGDPSSGTPRPICPELIQLSVPPSKFVCSFGGPIYSSSFNSFDLSKIHTYQIAYMKHQATNSSWAAFSVDSMGWLNITQASCNCFGGPNAVQPNLFPFVEMATICPPPNCKGSILSTGVFINYMFVTDYVPIGNQIPSGTLLPFFGPIPPSTSTCSNPYSDLSTGLKCAVSDIGGTGKFSAVIGGLLTFFGLFFAFIVVIYKVGIRQPLLYGAMGISLMILLVIIDVLPWWFDYVIVATVAIEIGGAYPMIRWRKTQEETPSG